MRRQLRNYWHWSMSDCYFFRQNRVPLEYALKHFGNSRYTFRHPLGSIKKIHDLDYSWWGTAVLKIEFSLWLSFYPQEMRHPKKQKLYNLTAVMLEMNRMD